MTRNKKILLGIIAIIIIAGIIVTVVLGLNKGMYYTDSEQVEIYLGKDVDLNKLREITNEVFGDEKVVLQVIDYFNDQISITTKKITDDQLSKLVELTNQEYNLTNQSSDFEIIMIPGVSIYDTVTPYIIPLSIAMFIILVYIIIKYRKLGILKIVLIPVISILIVEALYYSIIAITRVPVNRYTLPIGLAILLITLTVNIYNLENRYNKENK